MAQGKSDGTVYIDTKIDTSGIDDGMKNLGSDIKKNTKGVEDAGKELGEEFSEGFEKGISAPTQGIEQKLKTVSNSMTSFGNKMSLVVTAPLSMLGGKMVESAAEMNAAASQFSQVFGELEGDAASSLSKIADDTGIVEERLKGSYTSIAAFAKTTGLDTADALELSDRAMMAVADSAAFYDRSLEETAESLRSFLKGNYENDAALGLSATEFTRNAAAMELYGKSFNELSEAEKQLTLLKMVEDANALSGALGQASRESDTWSNVTGNLNQEFKNLLGTLGQNLLPVITPIVQFITELLKKFGELDPKTQKMIVIIGAVLAAIGPVASVIGSIISVVSTLIPIITAIIGALNPITIAIGALVAGIVLLISNWEAVTEAMQRFDNFLSKAFATDFTRILGPVLGEALNAFFANVKNVWESIKKIFGGVIDFITGVFSGNWEKAWKGIKDIFVGIWKLLSSAIKAPINGIISMVNGLVGGVVEGINLIIRAINSLDFDIPDWVPSIGGSHVGFNIKEINPPKIPYLAQGAVIPPNAPFMAMLGDQRNGRNLEAPEGLIRQIMREELSSIGVNVTFEVEGDPNGIFKVTQKKAREFKKRTGQEAYA